MDDELFGWGPALEEIERRKAEARAMGGEARLVRQHERGRLRRGERIEALFDAGTFHEIGQLVGTTERPPVPGDALVAGSGRIDGRPALAGAEDVTVLGGSIGGGASDKRYRLCQLAAQEQVPLVMMLEGAGHRVTDSVAGRRPGDLLGLAELSGTVPMVCLVLGASAGHGALTAPLCDFVAMTETASIFAAGPPLVKSATGEDVTKEALGGPAVAEASGVVHNVVADDVEAIALARRYLAHFPVNAWDVPPWRETGPTPARGRSTSWSSSHPTPGGPTRSTRCWRRSSTGASCSRCSPASAVRSSPCSRISVVAAWLSSPTTRASWPERSIGPRPTRPPTSSTWPARSGSRASSWPTTRVCWPEPRPSAAASCASAARMFAVQHRLQVPKLHVTLRKAFGFGSSIMAMNPFDGQTITLAFPSITLGALPASSEGSAIADPEERARVAAEQARASITAAGRLAYDDVIDPRQLRNALLAGLNLADGRHPAARPPRPIGILP